MAYEPTVWKTGDVVTSSKLNKLENAVAQSGGVLAVHKSNDTLDKTWQELFNAMSSGILCVIFGGDELDVTADIIKEVYEEQDESTVTYCANCGQTYVFTIDSSDGYPVLFAGR